MITGLFQYEGNKRPTIEGLKAHPWLNKPGFDYEQTREALKNEFRQRQNKPMPE